MRVADTPSDAETGALVSSLSNWGRFGNDDVLGTLNLLSPERRRAAAALVETGVTIPLGRRLRAKAGPDSSESMQHFMLRSGTEAPEHGYASASDWIGLGFHGFGVTHLDALSHVVWDRTLYNGRPAALVSTSRGATVLGVEDARAGIVGRGVLLDAPRFLGLSWLEPGQGLEPGDLTACLEAEGVSPAPGDILLVRTGRDARQAVHGPVEQIRDGSPGLLPSCLPWIAAADLALLGSDAVSDVMLPGAAPHLMPVHAVALVGLGLHLLDNALLEELAEACAVRGRWEFCVVIAPLRLQNTTGSPVNPLAIL